MPKKHTIRRYIIPFALITISILFFVLMIKNKPQAIQKAVSERAWSVDALVVKKNSHKPVLQLYGQIISTADIQLTASIEADVKKRWVNPGDSVKKGQVLLELDKTRLAQIRLQRQAELTEIEMQIISEKQQFETDNILLKHEKSLLKIANDALKRAKTLEKNSMASDSQLDDAKRASIQQELTITRLQANIANHPSRLAQLMAKQQQAQSRLALAEEDIKHTRILAPIDGVITNIAVDTAEHIQKGAALFSISDTANIEIQSLIPQSQYQQLRQTLSDGHKVNAIIVSNEQVLQASLSRLPATIDADQAGSYGFFRVADSSRKNTNNAVLIGQTVTVYAELAPATNSIAVPHDAIYGTDTVFIIKDARLKRTKVKWLGETFVRTSASSNNGVIAAGLISQQAAPKKWILIHSDSINNGDLLLTSKFANAMHGLKVKPVSVAGRKSTGIAK